MKYISQGKLLVSAKLLEFVNKDLLPGTNINIEKFWKDFDKTVHELAPRNRELLYIREKMQKQIDEWHLARKGQKTDFSSYTTFLRKIGYLVKVGSNFSIETKNIDDEISVIAGPQLVVPVMNARYALNAANARWGSLYNALYGTDAILKIKETNRVDAYDPERGKKVIEYARNFLDENVPLEQNSWKNISEIPKIYNGKLNLKLRNSRQFVGYSGKFPNLSSLLLKNNNLHIDIIFNPNGSNGRQDKAGIQDIILESAITTIIDHEDSVSA